MQLELCKQTVLQHDFAEWFHMKTLVFSCVFHVNLITLHLLRSV